MFLTLFLFIGVTAFAQSDDSGELGESIPFDPIRHVQRPLDGHSRLILACSIPRGQACQTGRGKDVHEYCQCGEGLTCQNQVCQPIPGYSGPILEGGGIRVDEVAELEPSGNRDRLPPPIVQRPIVQRPIDFGPPPPPPPPPAFPEDERTRGNREFPSFPRRIVQRPIGPHGRRIISRPPVVGRNIGEIPRSRIPVEEIVQRPIDVFTGREIMPHECRLPPFSRCNMPRKALDGYCDCAVGYFCSGHPGRCLPENSDMD